MVSQDGERGTLPLRQRMAAAAAVLALAAAPLLPCTAFGVDEAIAEVPTQQEAIAEAAGIDEAGPALDQAETLTVDEEADDEVADPDEVDPDEGSDEVDPDEGSDETDPDEDPGEEGPAYTGWVDAGGEPCDAAGAAGWVDAGQAAESKFFYDPATDAWYWAEADGSIARDHDAFVPRDNGVAGEAWEEAADEWRAANGKWVHLGADGALAKGFLLLPDDAGGLKWVFCDHVTGEMAHGERYIDGSFGDEPGWMYFDPVTGAVDYGWAWIPDPGKWVYYDEVTGRMRHGSVMVGGLPYYLDEHTGERLPRERVVERLLAVAASQAGVTDGDRYQNAAIAAGSSFNSFGPCTAFVYWCFQEAGLHYQFMDGGATTWPHEMWDWYIARGWTIPVGTRPQPGDIWVDNLPATRPFPEASATHSGIVDHVSADGRTIYVWEHVNGYVHLCEESSTLWYLSGYATPFYNEV